MNRTYVKTLYADTNSFGETEVTVRGWARTVRDGKNFGFIELNDGTCQKNCQVVLEREKLADYENIVHCGVGAALTVRGKVVLTPEMRQPFELRAEEVVVDGASLPTYPLQKKRHSPEFLREIAHLRPRTNLFGAVFRIRSQAAFAIHKFFNDRGFVYVHTPIITGSDCEGAGAMFRVTTLEPGETDLSKDFFGKRAALTVSGQLDVETYAMAFSNVYTFGPTFRAENSNTVRHAAEFWMIEPEMAFCDLAGDMDVAEAMVKFVAEYVHETCAFEVDFLTERVCPELKDRFEALKGGEFVRLSYTEAIDILKKAIAEGKTFEYPVEWGCDLQSEHERYLTETVFKKPVFLTDYPKGIKAFYMRLNDDNKTVAAADLLVPGIGELIGGSQREERLDVLEERMKECGLKAEDYEFYTDLRRYGGCVHSGFGLGFERLIMYLTGVSNIRDVIPFPRTVGNLQF